MSKTAWGALAALASVMVAAGCVGETTGGGVTTPQSHRISGAVGGATTAGVTVTLTGAASASTTTSSAGDYAFDGLANGTYTVKPAKGGFTFSPISQVVVVNGADVASQDFVATAASTTYAISGTVSGATAQGVTMTLSGTASGTTTTASDGTYSFTGLVNGSYTVTPSRLGYTFSPSSLTFTVSGGNATGKDFVATAISTTYAISGAVSGATAQGVTMTLSGTASGSTTTASDGTYSFTGLVNGSYTVTPSRLGYTFSPSSLTFTVSGGNATGKDFVATAVSTTYAISGTVSGATAQGVTMTLSGTASGSTTTASDGTYSFTGLVNGSYTVTPSRLGYTFSPSSLTFTVSGGNATGKDFVATAVSTTYAISGTVSGATAQGVTMTLSGTASGSTTTASDGTYSFTGLVNGSYTVTPTRLGYTFSPSSLTFTVSGGNATGKDFIATAISTTYAISGTVSGATAQGVTMTLSGTASGSTTTASDGTYSFTGLVNGSYTITPSKTGYTFSPSSLTFTVSGGNATGKDFTASAGGSVPIVKDANFPVSTWKNNVSGTTMTTPAFTTGNGPRTLVAVVSFYTPAQDPFPISVAWVGGAPSGATPWVQQVWPTTPASSSQFRSYALDPHDGSIHWTSRIWTATATSQLVSAAVVATRTGSDASTGILSVYSLANVAGFGAKAQHHSPMADVSNNISGPYTVTIDVQAANSEIIGISQGGDTYYAFTPNALTTIDYQQNDGGADGGAAAWHKTTPTSGPGNVTLGCTDSDLAFSVEAIELLAAP